jgi:hypothetical protein
LELIIQVGPDEVEKGLQIGVTGVLGELFTVSLKLVKKESTSSGDMEARFRSGKCSRNFDKSEP